MNPHAYSTEASRTFYLAFRRWCLLNRSAARRSYHDSNQPVNKHNDAVRSGPSRGQYRQDAGRLCTGELEQVPKKEQIVARRPIVDGLSKAPEQVDRRLIHSLQCNAMRRGLVYTGHLISTRRYSTSRSLAQERASGSDLAEPMRQALRTLTKPCVLVTSCTDIDDSTSYSGVTLSSFDAVTLHPVPHISFNIRVPSRTYDNFKASKQICVHILSASSAGATVADTFTKPYASRHEPFEHLKEAGALIQTATATPQVQLEDGVISWLLCERSSIKDVDVGDHKICAFVVKKILVPEDVDLDTAQALAYGQQAFRALGVPVDPTPVPLINLKANDRASTSRSTSSTKSSQARGALLARPNTTISTTSTSCAQSSSFHTSSKRLFATPPILLASFRIAVWSTGIGTANALPSLPAEEDPIPVDERKMKQTVGDFLCHNPDNPGQRILRLRVAQKQIEDASATLKTAMADGSLTIEECERLEDLIETNGRWVARTLAIRAARELRAMLDQGHVSESRIQYIEMCIEKGQAALIADAQDLATGKKPTGFGKMRNYSRKPIEEDDDLFRTELMRLREYYEERDGDDDS